MRNFNKSNNPFLKEDKFKESPVIQTSEDGPIIRTNEYTMSVYGAINKTIMLMGILLVTALYSFTSPNMILTIGGAILGLIAVLVASFKPKTSPITAPLYAAFEGLFVGGITAMYANAYDGIVFQAVSATICVLLAMLMIYRSGLIKVTNKFRTGVMMATGGILLLYVVTWLLSFMGIQMPFLHQTGPMGIGISVVIIGVAALNLLLDFDFFEKGEQAGAPKYMEWFAGMGLLVTLVWLYVEILRLLSLLSRD